MRSMVMAVLAALREFVMKTVYRQITPMTVTVTSAIWKPELKVPYCCPLIINMTATETESKKQKAKERPDTATTKKTSFSKKRMQTA